MLALTVSEILTLALIHSEILTFYVDVENSSQCHGSNAIIPFDDKFISVNVYTNHNPYFALALAVSEILTFQMFELDNIGQGRPVQ